MADKKEEAVKQAIKDAQEAAAMESEKEAAQAEDVTQEAEEAADEVQEGTQEPTEPENKEEAEEIKTSKLFGKDKKKKEKDKSKEKIEELEDKVKRQLAEFENFRNRSEKEKAQMFDMGAKNVLEKILPVVDNFERGLMTVPSEGEKAFADGMQMIYKQLMTELESIGVKPIEAVGQEFDPNFHNAVMQVESEEYETGVVAQELMKGYTYKDTVLRHSMVAVVQ
ncbi:MAG: nucleotide exchange factor GrpE [Lachnospiraceae bacterium]|nr:nucleotide exchange factor GrpE [Lachnospiraceae bacterium]